MEKVSFKNRNCVIAAHLYLPPKFDAGKKYAALICAHPVSSCKEQTAAIYAKKNGAGRLYCLGF